MPLLHFGPAGDTAVGVFAGTAAVLIVGGPMLLSWQRNKQDFLLKQAAIAQGATTLPKGPPAWLGSLKQAIITLTLGIALMVIGGVATALTHETQSSAPPAPTTAPIDIGGWHIGPHPSPEMEAWQREQTINSLGLMSLAGGGVLTLLGIVRIVFARLERRYEPV